MRWEWVGGGASKLGIERVVEWKGKVEADPFAYEGGEGDKDWAGDSVGGCADEEDAD
jgi:hypothetical protein